MSENFNKKLMLLHRVVTQNYNDLDSLLSEYLSVGNEILNTDIAIASHIKGEVYTINQISPNHESMKKGLQLNFRDTWCYDVYHQRKTIHFPDASKEKFYKSHPAYLSMGLCSYISTPIYVLGEIYGTLNFSSFKVRPMPFSEEEVEILEMMAQSVGHFIEMGRHKLISEKSAKMALIGEMAGGIVHEINNPMAVISSNSDFISAYLSQKDILNKDLEESLNSIKYTVKRVRDIVEGLRIIMGGGEVSIEAIKLRDIIDSTMAVVWDKFRHSRVEIINDVSPDIYVFANKVQLSQVILNLAQNSFDAIIKNENLWVNFSVIERGGFVELLVKDSGTGIDKELVDKIMEPFYTTKSVGKGTGLGLSLSKSIVESFGGELSYDQQCINTCFKIRLTDARTAERSAG